MDETDKPEIHQADDVPTYEQIQTEEPKAPFGQDEPNPNVVSDATSDDLGVDSPEGDPGLGGYEGRDPKSDMPRVPTDPDSQHDPQEHGGQPKTPKEPPASH